MLGHIVRSFRAAWRAYFTLGDEVLTFGRPDEVWIDVGAHLGETTFPFARLNPSLRIYAFEPNLKIAAQRMGLLRNFVVVPMAVAETDGCASFYVNNYDMSSSLLPLDAEGRRNWVGGEVLRELEKITVPTIRLDTFMNGVGISRVSYLKVDAQGADLSVVKSAGERLKDIDRLTLEVAVTPQQLYSGAARKEEIQQFMAEHHFSLASTESQSHGQEENLTFVREVS